MCPDGYEKVPGTIQCIKTGSVTKHFTEHFQQAYDICAAEGANLYQPQSKEEMELVADFLFAKIAGKN